MDKAVVGMLAWMPERIGPCPRLPIEQELYRNRLGSEHSQTGPN